MVKLSFPTSQYRSLPSPAGKGKVGFFFVPAGKMPPELREWRDVNPREVKTTSSVYRAIVTTLTEEPDRFAERNRGLTISATDVEYDEKRREVVLTMTDTALHGVIDGGHTLHAVLETQPTKNGDWSAEVFIKVMTGIASDQIAEIAGGLNSSQQVDLRSLENLKDHFSALRKVLTGQPYADNIAYKMNEDKEIDVREILYYLAVFDAGSYSDNAHPTNLFGRKEGLVRKFALENAGTEKSGDSFAILITKAPEILRLRDLLEQRMLQQENIGRYKAGRNERVRSRNNRKNRLYFIDEEVNGKISLGWIMPMLGAFRANVLWDKPKGTFSWKVIPETLLDSCFDGLFAGVLEIHERENARPEYVGRNATAWRMCYEKVKTAILEHELAAMRKS